MGDWGEHGDVGCYFEQRSCSVKPWVFNFQPLRYLTEVSSKNDQLYELRVPSQCILDKPKFLEALTVAALFWATLECRPEAAMA